jgi:hypothetical protein
LSISYCASGLAAAEVMSARLQRLSPNITAHTREL